MASWWQGPRLRTDEEEHRERRTSWLELFYDLIFVAVISHLSQVLSRGVTPASVTAFVVLSIPVWWVWVGGTLYNERFEADDVSHRLIVFIQMVPVIGLAVNIGDAFGARGDQFIVAYVASRLLIIFLWLRGGYHDRSARPLTTRYATGFAIGAALWAFSYFTPAPVRYWLWTAGLSVDLVTPLFTLRQQSRLPALSASHLTERFGLFTMIVLGEAVLAVVTGVAARTTLPLAVAVAANLGLALAFGLWWIYFDQATRALRGPNIRWRFAWDYLHLPLTMSLVAAGAGIRLLVSDEMSAVSPGVRWLACCAVAGALGSVGAMQFLTRPSKRVQVRVVSPALKVAAAGASVVLAALGSGLGVVPLLLVLAVLVGMHVIYDGYLWYTRQEVYRPAE
jgi:low temperature requirement protein LtrA